MSITTEPVTLSKLQAVLDILLSDTAVMTAVVGTAVAFILKLLGDYITEKNRQATNVRVLAAYIDLAIENWTQQGIAANPQSQIGFRIAKYDEVAVKTTRIPNIDGAGGELYTPFVPFSSHDDLALDEVRVLIGFLKNEEIEAVVRFVELEALTHAIARDFRSEYVRRAFTQERKVGLLERFNDTLVRARCAADCARDALAPFKECPTCLWYLPGGLRAYRCYYTCTNSGPNKQCQLDKSAGGTKPCQCFGQQPKADPQSNQPRLVERNSEDGQRARSGGMHGSSSR